MPNWTDDDGNCDCPMGHAAGLGPGRHRSGVRGCVSGPPARARLDADKKAKAKTEIRGVVPKGKKGFYSNVESLIARSTVGAAAAAEEGVDLSSVPDDVVRRTLERADELEGQRNPCLDVPLGEHVDWASRQNRNMKELEELAHKAERTVKDCINQAFLLGYTAGSEATKLMAKPLFSRRQLEEAILDVYSLLPPERVRLVRPASQTAISAAADAIERRKENKK